MQGQYNIAIYPSEGVIALIKRMKERLAEKIGWFHSKNAVAHITISQFKASDSEIAIVKRQLAEVCKNLQSSEVALKDFGAFENGAFYIAPDGESKEQLLPLMLKVNSVLTIPDLNASDDPHISIARRLSPEKLRIAERLFTSINVRFQCESIVLRKFDPKIKQYFVEETFFFGKNN